MSSSSPILCQTPYSVSYSEVQSIPFASPPIPQYLGYIQYPDGRKVPTTQVYSATLPAESTVKEIEGLRAQLTKTLQDNHVLRIAWEGARCIIQKIRAE